MSFGLIAPLLRFIRLDQNRCRHSHSPVKLALEQKTNWRQAKGGGDKRRDEFDRDQIKI